MNKTVLLTGVSGYIGLHCAQQLLASGYHVRGSVRSESKAQEVTQTLSNVGADISNLTIVTLDLNSDHGWQEAATGCDFVIHMASPFVIANPKNEAEIISPAVDGTLRVMRAAKTAGVRRLVLTSSILSMMGSMKSGTVTPNDWTNISAANVSAYTKSKTLAERAAWDFLAEQTGENTMEMVSINPGGVFGPPLGRDITGQSMDMLDQMLRGKMPMVPRAAFPMVDVRDVAMLHVKALEQEGVAGKRMIAASANACGFAEMAQVLIDAGYKGPSARIAPNFLLRLMALFDREAKGMLGFLDMNINADTRQTRDAFDWTPRSVDESMLDSAKAVKAIQESR